MEQPVHFLLSDSFLSTLSTVSGGGLPDSPTSADLRSALQKGPDSLRLLALKHLILQTLSGQSNTTSLLMPVIQYVLPSKSKQLKKLVHFYWEVCPKYEEGKDGALRQEMILVCNAIRNDLQHPNEYIRGATLRFLQKIREVELLEPLVPTARACLQHRHSYVRKNAIFAILSIYRVADHLLPDAAELLETFLVAEIDPTCLRNAFVALASISPPTALQWLKSNLDSVAGMDEILQLAIVEVIRKEGPRVSPADKAKYIRLTLELLSSNSRGVKYEAATTLTGLTGNPSAVKAAATCYISLITKESDNNVKLIVLERLDALRQRFEGEGVLEALVVDLLAVLSSTDMEVKKKALEMALPLVNSRNVEEVVGVLKKELSKPTEGDKNNEYRTLLISTIHTLSLSHPSIATSTIFHLLPFLSDPISTSSTSTAEVVSFVREAVHRFHDLRSPIVKQLSEGVASMKSGKVLRGALWIMGEYAETKEEVKDAWRGIREAIGEVPIHEEKVEGEEEGEGKTMTKTKVLEDGTYVTEVVTEKKKNDKLSSKPPLRALILGGDFYTAAVLVVTITKLVLRMEGQETDTKFMNSLRAEAMLIMTSIIRVGQSAITAVPIDEDTTERIFTCLNVLSNPNNKTLRRIFLQDTQDAYVTMLKQNERVEKEKKSKERKDVKVQPDEVISFRGFAKKGAEGVDEQEADLKSATGGEQKEDFVNRLSRVVQLTGFSDPVYAEAYVKVQQFDIILDVLIVNQTTETLQNLTLEFATLGDLKLIEKPVNYTLGPHSFQSMKATVKVSSTETGVIFGNIFYDASLTTQDSHAVVLNDIHIDILDYIQPASCPETSFRNMWTEFEWENRVNVNTTIDSLKAYLQHVMSATNMSCLTPEAALEGDCGFLSANLYARSLFGEDALANLSIEKTEDSIQGHVRIRSKTQGIALALGDKIGLAQRLVT